MPRAYSYLRFSTPEQSQGDSTRRQLQAAKDYVERHGLELDESLGLADEGVSAFRGHNTASGGKLALFLDYVRSGQVERGSYLLIENLDRMSRQTARKAVRVLEDICEEGITVVTLNDGREYTAESLDSDPLAFVFAIIGFMRAHEESATKAGRLKESWKAKRARAGEQKMTSACPAWLRLDRKRGKFVAIPERVQVVRRIFRDTLKGVGQHTIAETLNSEGVPVFGRGKHWHRTYISKILQSPTVVGTLEAYSEEVHKDDLGRVVTNKNGLPKRKRERQATIERYYPAVIDRDTWERVQALMQSANSPLRGRHVGAELHNLLGGLCKCGRCGSTVTLANKGKPPKGGRYLVCTAAKAKARMSRKGRPVCKYQALRYEQVERLFLDNAQALLANPPAGTGRETIDLELDSAEAGLDVINDTIENLLRAIERGGRSATLTARLRELEAARDRARKDIDSLRRKRDTASGALVTRRAYELADLLVTPEFDRVAANTLMRQCFTSVVVDYATGQLVFHWRHGGESNVLVAWPELPKRKRA